MVDWNEDGRKDLLVGQFNGQVALYLNEGTPGNPVLTFAGYLQVGGRALDVEYNSVPWVDDWDEDGRKDLLVGSMDGRVWLFINAGTNAAPLFNQVQYVMLACGDTLRVPSRAAPCVVDLDGDGLEDLIMGQINGNASYFRSLGENPTPLLDEPDTLRVGGEALLSPGPMSRFAALDWDGDGLMDLLGGPMDARLKLFRQIAPGSVPPAPLLEVLFEGPIVVPDSGAVLHFTCSLRNPSSQPLQFDIWADLFGPGNHNLMALQEAAVHLAPGESLAHDFQWRVPASAPYGFYRCYVFAGDHQRFQVCTADTFDFQKVLDLFDAKASSDQSPSISPQPLSLRAAPNPFNPSARINYELTEAGHIELAVFNAAGQQIATLVDGYREAGQHQVTWDASDLPTGVYLVALDAASSHAVQKVLLLK